MTARSHVTKREAQAIVDYARDVCVALGMPIWTILVMEDPCKGDAEATVDWIEQRHVAQVWLNADWMKYPDARRRDTITHEVLHLLHSRVSAAALIDSKAYMRSGEHKDWSKRVQRELELMVDHLAGFLSRTHNLEDAWDAAHGREVSR